VDRPIFFILSVQASTASIEGNDPQAGTPAG
jgi:hypothetical protein